jgi:hypothetical protein
VALLFIGGRSQDSIRRTLNIAEQVGFRAMLTHPIDKEAARIYQNFVLKLHRSGRISC